MELLQGMVPFKFLYKCKWSHIISSKLSNWMRVKYVEITVYYLFLVWCGEKSCRMATVSFCCWIRWSTAAKSSPTQLSQKLQWEVRGGRNVLHVKQYLSFTTCWLMRISLVLGGGRYEEDPEVSESRARSFCDQCDHMWSVCGGPIPAD